MSDVDLDANPLSVLIVGCGNIAGGFDMGRAPGYMPFTHAGAYAHDSRFSLSACVEPDELRRSKFMEHWAIPSGFHSIDDLIKSDTHYDLVSICSPTVCHAHDLEIAMRLKPQAIFCEKPITASLAETEKCVIACDKVNMPLAVNYTRRWDPDVLKLKVEMQAGHWGQLRSISGLYNKGILNNGSHMLDLLHYLIGPLKIIKIGKPIIDFSATDPSIPVWLEDERQVPIQIACAHAEDYAVFELQLVFSMGIVTMEEGGMFWRERRALDSDLFKGYRRLDEGRRRDGAYPQAMLQAIDNIYHSIAQDMTLASNGHTALVTHRVCDEIKQQACIN